MYNLSKANSVQLAGITGGSRCASACSGRWRRSMQRWQTAPSRLHFAGPTFCEVFLSGAAIDVRCRAYDQSERQQPDAGGKKARKREKSQPVSTCSLTSHSVLKRALIARYLGLESAASLHSSLVAMNTSAVV